MDLKHEIERELDQSEPPDLWERIQAQAADHDRALVDLAAGRHRRHRSPWLAAAVAAALIVLVGTLALTDDEQTLDTTPVTEPTAPAQIWLGPELDRGSVVHPMTPDPTASVPGLPTELFDWRDPLDAAVGSVDITRLTYQPSGPGWRFVLAAKPPALGDLEPGMILSYGVVFDTNADGVADYTAGIDAPVQGDFRSWATDVASGETQEQIGPPYGFPLEFTYPADDPPEGDPTGSVRLLFLSQQRGDSVGARLARDLDPRTVRFFVWASVTRDDVLVANDYAPDTDWMAGE